VEMLQDAGRQGDAPELREVRVGTALALALVLTWLSGYWIRQAEVIARACEITEAVPAIPGIAALLFLLAVNPLIRHLPLARQLSNGEIILIYLFVSVGTTMHAAGIGRFLIAFLTVPYYYSTPGAPLTELTPWIPAWLSPNDPVVHEWLFEGAPTAMVPWEVWRWPIAAWAGFFVLLGGTLMCFMLLFAERWMHHERLAFPLVRFPLEIAGVQTPVALLRNPVAWVGMGLATLTNAIFMVRAVFFGGPSGTVLADVDLRRSEGPLRWLGRVTAILRPELIGLGYLTSTELAFSIWFFYLFVRFQALVLNRLGYRSSTLPYVGPQGMGAYTVFGLMLLWQSRGALTRAARGLLGGHSSAGEERPLYRWALLGAVLGMFGLMAFMVSAGMEPWLAALYMVALLMVGIVYARVRAETGMPLVWAFPVGQPHKVILNFLGQARVVGAGLAKPRSATVFALMSFLSRGFFPTVSGYQIEGVHLAERTGVSWPQMSTSLVMAIAVGSVSAFLFHLPPCYQHGVIALQGGLWGEGLARAYYTDVLHGAQTPAPPDVGRIAATCVGGLTIALLGAARSHWFGFPLHPIGYALIAYSDRIWMAFLIVWLAKSLVLHYGGSRAYVKALPGFLGFALGHFISAGLIWGSLQAVLGGPFLRWRVYFG